RLRGPGDDAAQARPAAAGAAVADGPPGPALGRLPVRALGAQHRDLGAQAPGGRRRDQQPRLGQPGADPAFLPRRLPHHRREPAVPAGPGNGARRPRSAHPRPPARGAAGSRQRPRRARGAAAVLRHHPVPAAGRRHPRSARAAAPGRRPRALGGRMNLRWRVRGLHAKFALLAGATLLLMLAVVLLMLQRQRAMQDEVIGRSGDAMHELVFERLRQHGEAASAQVAESLVNPLYYFDLDAIGVIARNVLRQPDVRYVLVYDNNGNILHDGSGDIPTFGQAMRDPLAYEAVSATGVHAQWTERILDISSPVRVGDQRLGGVRIGYSLDEVRGDEQKAAQSLRENLGA